MTEILKEENVVAVITETDEDGKRQRWVEETLNTNGELVAERVDEYFYYETGEIDLITLRKYDAKGDLVSEKQVQHFLDGRNIEVVVDEVKASEPMEL